LLMTRLPTTTAKATPRNSWATHITISEG
jgi:hypothetical protein